MWIFYTYFFFTNKQIITKLVFLLLIITSHYIMTSDSVACSATELRKQSFNEPVLHKWSMNRSVQLKAEMFFWLTTVIRLCDQVCPLRDRAYIRKMRGAGLRMVAFVYTNSTYRNYRCIARGLYTDFSNKTPGCGLYNCAGNTPISKT